MCERQASAELEVTITEARFAEAYERWLAACEEVGQFMVPDLTHSAMWREVVCSATD